MEFKASASMTMTVPVEGVSPETLSLLWGGDPQPPRHVMTIATRECPFEAPRRRRGLTGKRYRIARRAYHRDMTRWRRGLVEPRVVTRTLYGVMTDVQPVPGGGYSVGFKAQPRH